MKEWMRLRSPAFFAELRRRVFDRTEGQFHDVIRAIIVGEMYEGLGKVSTSMLSGTHECRGWRCGSQLWRNSWVD